MARTDPVDTGIWTNRLEQLLRQPITHLFKVTIVPAAGASFAVPVDGRLQVTRSLAWSPYAQAQVTIKTPTDATQLAALDGRLRTWVKVEMGYAYEGTQELRTVALLRLEDADQDLVAGTMDLSCQGLEMEQQDATWSADWNALVPRGGIREAIDYVMDQAGTGLTRAWSGVGAGYRADLVTAENFSPGDGTSLWSIASGLADQAGLKLWYDGENPGTWHLKARYAISGTYATMLRTGKTGTITRGKRQLGRTDWANEVHIVYSDTDQGNGRPVYGNAQLASGPYSRFAVGRKVHYETRAGQATLASAQAAATALLSTLAARGVTHQVDAAAAYWLRPGMTVPVKRDRGPYERQLVQAVTFNPLQGLMTVDTIKSED
jgi:hypothetical protein